MVVPFEGVEDLVDAPGSEQVRKDLAEEEEIKDIG